MPITVTDLLAKGYFPKELPPCFTSGDFSNHAIAVGGAFSAIFNAFPPDIKKIKKNEYSHSQLIKFSIPKVGLIRKNLGVPNPYHFYKLSDYLIANMPSIQTHLGLSNFSISKPDLTNVGVERCFESSCDYGEFLEICLDSSVGSNYQVRTDISRYYPTVYTHALAWGYHSKAVAKANFAANVKGVGEKIDDHVRHCQENQSVGIPIGPDTSLLVSEILGVRIDLEIQAAFPHVKGARWIDDLYLYTNDIAEAERLFKFIQGKFREFQLEPNEGKTKITKQPVYFDGNWVIDIKKYDLTAPSDKTEREAIWNYFNLVNRLLEENPEKSILKFALGKIREFKVRRTNWDLFESFILNAFRSDPSVAKYCLIALLSHQTLINIPRIKETVENVIKDYLAQGKEHEVIWALWFVITFSLSIDATVIDGILNGSNSLAKSLLFEHLRATGNVRATNIIRTHTFTSFFTDNWIFDYQVYRYQANSTVTGHEFFDLLKARDVSFINLDLQLDITNHYPRMTYT